METAGVPIFNEKLLAWPVMIKVVHPNLDQKQPYRNI